MRVICLIFGMKLIDYFKSNLSHVFLCSPTGWMMMTNRSYRLNLEKFSMEFANYCYKINCGEVALKTSVLDELN